MSLLKKFRDLSMKIQLIVFFLAVGIIPWQSWPGCTTQRLTTR